jgi:hypothetical protein
MSTLMVSGKLSLTIFLYISLSSAIIPPFLVIKAAASKHPSAALRCGP